MEKVILDYFRTINYGVEDKLDGLNYRYFHCLRTAKLAREILEAEGLAEKIDAQAVLLLALFHDIGKNEKLLAENDLSYEEHDANNVLLFEKYLYPQIKDQNLVASLRRITADFSHKRYELPESRLVRDADNLDEIGILNFWRMAVYAGKHHADNAASNKYYFACDRPIKIEKMKGLFFDYSQKVYVSRLEEMDELMERFRQVGVPSLEELEG